MHVGDLIKQPAREDGRFRVWRVVGVYLGGQNQESVVGLETLDLLANTQRREMIVPLEMVEPIKNQQTKETENSDGN